MSSRIAEALKSSSTSLDLSNCQLSEDELDKMLPQLLKLKLKELNLSANKMKKLPSNLPQLSSIQELDIAQNPFVGGIKNVLPVLKAMEMLKSLTLTLTSNEDGESVVLALPNLVKLNGTALDLTHGESEEEEAVEGSKREIALTQGDLEGAAVLFGALKALSRLNNKEDEQEAQRFNAHIHKVVDQLKTNVESTEDAFLRQGQILLAKHQMYEICFAKAVDLSKKEGGPELGAVLQKLKEVHSVLFGEFFSVMGDIRPYYAARLSEMQQEVVRAERETQELLEAAELLDSEAATHAREKDELGAQFAKERGKILTENSSLRKEHNSMMLRIKDLEEQLVQSGRPTSRPRKAPKATMKPSNATVPATPPPPAPETTERKKKSPLPVRSLTLKQLKDYIDAIYASKLKFDAKCADAHLPRETMEEHMYTYLNQKYGLKSLIVEHASAIVKAVHRYSAEDNDVSVFGKILRNEIDEEFQFVQRKLKDTVAELLRLYLKGKFPMKTDDAVLELLDKRLAGFVYKEEWIDIVKYMFNHEDSLALIVMLTDLSSRTEQELKEKRESRSTQSNSNARCRIRFCDFLKVLLDFLLVGHERYLAPFRDMFFSINSERDGVLNEDQFRQLVKKIDPSKSEEDMGKLLAVVDPFKNQRVTFSECVVHIADEFLSSANQATKKSTF